MNEKCFTPEQLSELRSRASRLGPEAVQDNERQWKRLMAEVKALHDRGADPACPEMQALAARTETLVHFITGGNPGLGSALVSFYRAEPESVSQALGVRDSAVFQFLGTARRIQRGS